MGRGTPSREPGDACRSAPTHVDNYWLSGLPGDLLERESLGTLQVGWRVHIEERVQLGIQVAQLWCLNQARMHRLQHPEQSLLARCLRERGEYPGVRVRVDNQAQPANGRHFGLLSKRQAFVS